MTAVRKSHEDESNHPSQIGAPGRSAGGANRADPVFQPSNGEARRFHSQVRRNGSPFWGWLGQVHVKCKSHAGDFPGHDEMFNELPCLSVIAHVLVASLHSFTNSLLNVVFGSPDA